MDVHLDIEQQIEEAKLELQSVTDPVWRSAIRANIVQMYGWLGVSDKPGEFIMNKIENSGQMVTFGDGAQLTNTTISQSMNQALATVDMDALQVELTKLREFLKSKQVESDDIEHDSDVASVGKALALAKSGDKPGLVARFGEFSKRVWTHVEELGLKYLAILSVEIMKEHPSGS